MTKAKDLERGDDIVMLLHGEVLSVEPVADGKRLKIRVAVENKGMRGRGHRVDPAKTTLEFTDAGHVLEFICKPGQQISGPYKGEDDWRGGEPEPELPPDAGTRVLA